MHPHMYGDNSKLGYNLRERLSCTRNVFFGKRAAKGQDRSQSCSLGNHNDSDSSMIGIDKQLHGICDSATPGSVFNYDVGIQVPIGPLFQVEVPEWTGVVSESDAKWLGTRVWPLEKTEKRSFVELDRIGKGRSDSCGCHNQESTQCVKFHVRERRLKVKLELGSAFNKWKFDKMGEDVAFAWAEEEQKMFLSIVKSNPPSPEKSFWDDIYKYFPKKSREELVCYYYNVFLLQCRAYQNRMTPSNINSDDEEPKDEEESFVKGGGREAIKSYTSILISPKKSHKSRYTS
ncbi:G-type lectin S-receptor-like serine/threonine-protein kinase SD2-2-like [Hibiscus syriacus]|uniref:G-type lectin S-receptor-like serine/threonine-protein kinase SD2-2-like n=1 Tax=Hibiscus syriacus TaxID=106335 RepID=A0A6A2WHT6_HIBSY|nr:G-type lectin S-receptor-like serine/threonine-protein kinase SD2-2-like [Hibiscus syriacus]